MQGRWESDPTLPANEDTHTFHNDYAAYFKTVQARLTAASMTAICDCEHAFMQQTSQRFLRYPVENWYLKAAQGPALSFFLCVVGTRAHANAARLYALDVMGAHDLNWLAPCFRTGVRPCVQTGCPAGECLNRTFDAHLTTGE